MNEKIPKAGDFYYHFKHNSNKDLFNYAYIIIGIAIHSETEELLVAYKPLYSPNHVFDNKCDFCVRPLNMFIENVEKPNYIGPRFRLITDAQTIDQLRKENNK